MPHGRYLLMSKRVPSAGSTGSLRLLVQIVTGLLNPGHHEPQHPVPYFALVSDGQCTTCCIITGRISGEKAQVGMLCTSTPPAMFSTPTQVWMSRPTTQMMVERSLLGARARWNGIATTTEIPDNGQTDLVIEVTCSPEGLSRALKLCRETARTDGCRPWYMVAL